MNKEAAGQTKGKSAQTSQHSMQRYLRYLKSNLQPALEAEQYASQRQLNAWRQYRTS